LRRKLFREKNYLAKADKPTPCVGIFLNPANAQSNQVVLKELRRSPSTEGFEQSPPWCKLFEPVKAELSSSSSLRIDWLRNPLPASRRRVGCLQRIVEASTITRNCKSYCCAFRQGRILESIRVSLIIGISDGVRAIEIMPSVVHVSCEIIPLQIARPCLGGSA